MEEHGNYGTLTGKFETEYFNNVASGFDNDRSIDDDESIDCIVKSHEWHTSLQLIQENITLTDDLFYFSEVTSNEVKS